MIEAIISGGQTGADLGGMKAARKHGIAIEGWAPRGWLTERGPEPKLEGWGLKEHARGYASRTRTNIDMADVVLVFGKRWTPGSRLTLGLAEARLMPVELHQWFGDGWGDEHGRLRPAGVRLGITNWLRVHNPERLMIAGNRESRNPGIGQAVFDLMDLVLKEVGR